MHRAADLALHHSCLAPLAKLRNELRGDLDRGGAEGSPFGEGDAAIGRNAVAHVAQQRRAHSCARGAAGHGAHSEGASTNGWAGDAASLCLRGGILYVLRT